MRQMYIDYYRNNSFDVMCMPTTPSTAPPIYSVEPYMLFNGQYLPNRVRALCARGIPHFAPLSSRTMRSATDSLSGLEGLPSGQWGVPRTCHQAWKA